MNQPASAIHLAEHALGLAGAALELLRESERAREQVNAQAAELYHERQRIEVGWCPECGRAKLVCTHCGTNPATGVCADEMT